MYLETEELIFNELNSTIDISRNSTKLGTVLGFFCTVF